MYLFIIKSGLGTESDIIGFGFANGSYRLVRLSDHRCLKSKTMIGGEGGKEP